MFVILIAALMFISGIIIGVSYFDAGGSRDTRPWEQKTASDVVITASTAFPVSSPPSVLASVHGRNGGNMRAHRRRAGVNEPRAEPGSVVETQQLLLPHQDKLQPPSHTPEGMGWCCFAITRMHALNVVMRTIALDTVLHLRSVQSCVLDHVGSAIQTLFLSSSLLMFFQLECLHRRKRTSWRTVLTLGLRSLGQVCALVPCGPFINSIVSL
jgi:hypothetical protein